MLFTLKSLLLAAMLAVPALSRPETHKSLRMVKRGFTGVGVPLTPIPSVSCSPINDDCKSGAVNTLSCCLYPTEDLTASSPPSNADCNAQFSTNMAACASAYSQYPTALALAECRDEFASSMNLDTTANMNAISTCTPSTGYYVDNYVCTYFAEDFEC